MNFFLLPTYPRTWECKAQRKRRRRPEEATILVSLLPIQTEARWFGFLSLSEYIRPQCNTCERGRGKVFLYSMQCGLPNYVEMLFRS